MPSVLWFRRDLRLDDNPALLAAAEAGRDGVVALFVLEDRLLASAGAPRIAYLVDSLTSLNESLDGGLTVVRGDARTAVPAVARDVAASSVHIAGDHTPFGRGRDTAVEESLGKIGVRLLRAGSPYAVSPGTVRTKSGTAYQVFTPFLRAWLATGWPAPASSGRGTVRWVPAPAGAGADRLPHTPDLGPMRLPRAGEERARRRWRAFRDDHLADYDRTRDRPDLPGTSRLSIALQLGEIHPRTLLADVSEFLAGDREEHGRAGAEVYRAELAWREFHADVLAEAPSAATRSLRVMAPTDAWVSGALEHERLGAWARGRTGYPMVDAGMRQLLAEGWMHNRVRMIVASFLVKDLHVRWQRGAEHFMRVLVDGDVASNQLNWQWVAGTGRDASPFYRIFNPVTQGLRFDPNGDYVRRYVPELADVPGRAAHEPWRLPGGIPGGYPERVVDHAVERAQALADHARRPRV